MAHECWTILLPAKDVYKLGGPLSGFLVFASLYMYFGGTLSVSGFLIPTTLRPSPMLEGIGFGWAPIGFAVKSLFQ